MKSSQQNGDANLSHNGGRFIASRDGTHLFCWKDEFGDPMEKAAYLKIGETFTFPDGYGVPFSGCLLWDEDE